MRLFLSALSAIACTALSTAAMAETYTLRVVNRTSDNAVVSVFQKPQTSVPPGLSEWIKLSQPQQTIQLWEAYDVSKPLCTLDVTAGETIYLNEAPSGILAFFSPAASPCTTK
jgi:hypothetical protein